MTWVFRPKKGFSRNLNIQCREFSMVLSLILFWSSVDKKNWRRAGMVACAFVYICYIMLY